MCDRTHCYRPLYRYLRMSFGVVGLCGTHYRADKPRHPFAPIPFLRLRELLRKGKSMKGNEDAI